MSLAKVNGLLMSEAWSRSWCTSP